MLQALLHVPILLNVLDAHQIGGTGCRLPACLICKLASLAQCYWARGSPRSVLKPLERLDKHIDDLGRSSGLFAEFPDGTVQHDAIELYFLLVTTIEAQTQGGLP